MLWNTFYSTKILILCNWRNKFYNIYFFFFFFGGGDKNYIYKPEKINDSKDTFRTCSWSPSSYPFVLYQMKRQKGGKEEKGKKWEARNTIFYNTFWQLLSSISIQYLPPPLLFHSYPSPSHCFSGSGQPKLRVRELRLEQARGGGRALQLEKARGPSTAAGEGGTNMKQGGGGSAEIT